MLGAKRVPSGTRRPAYTSRRELTKLRQFYREAKLLAFFTFNISVMFFALVLIITAGFDVHAQTTVEVEDLARRITSMEALNLDHRLTIIETLLNDLHSDHWTHLGTMVGTGLLILERGARAIGKKVNEAE